MTQSSNDIKNTLSITITPFTIKTTTLTHPRKTISNLPTNPPKHPSLYPPNHPITPARVSRNEAVFRASIISTPSLFDQRQRELSRPDMNINLIWNPPPPLAPPTREPPTLTVHASTPNPLEPPRTTLWSLPASCRLANWPIAGKSVNSFVIVPLRYRKSILYRTGGAAESETETEINLFWFLLRVVNRRVCVCVEVCLSHLVLYGVFRMRVRVISNHNW